MWSYNDKLLVIIYCCDKKNAAEQERLVLLPYLPHFFPTSHIAIGQFFPKMVFWCSEGVGSLFKSNHKLVLRVETHMYSFAQLTVNLLGTQHIHVCGLYWTWTFNCKSPMWKMWPRGYNANLKCSTMCITAMCNPMQPPLMHGMQQPLLYGVQTPPNLVPGYEGIGGKNINTVRLEWNKK